MKVVNKPVSVKSKIKGYPVYPVPYSIGTKLGCFLEPENEHHDIVKIIRKGDITVGHISECSCQPLTQLLKDDSIVQITCCVIYGNFKVSEF